MLFFILLLVITIILAFMVSKKARKRTKWIPFLIMLLLCGLRGKEVGTDTYNYFYNYQIGFGLRMEPLFVATANVCKLLGLTPHQFLFVLAMLVFVPLYFIAKKYSKNANFSALIFMAFSVTFFGMAFNGVRQSIAMAFSLVSVCYLSDEKRVKSIIALSIATLFHYSSAILLPFMLFFYFYRSFSKKLVYTLLVSSLIFGLSFGQNDYFLHFFDYVQLLTGNEAILKNYSNYSDISNVATLNVMGLLVSMLPFTMYGFFLYDDKNKDSLLYKLVVVGAIVSNVFISVHYIYRIAAYFILPIMIVLPETQERTRDMRHDCLVGLNVIMILLYVYLLLTADRGAANGIFPYSTCFYS